MTELTFDEIEAVNGGAIPVLVVILGRAAFAAATSSTGKAIFAGAAAIAGAAAAGVFDQD